MGRIYVSEQKLPFRLVSIYCGPYSNFDFKSQQRTTNFFNTTNRVSVDMFIWFCNPDKKTNRTVASKDSTRTILADQENFILVADRC